MEGGRKGDIKVLICSCKFHCCISCVSQSSWIPVVDLLHRAICPFVQLILEMLLKRLCLTMILNLKCNIVNLSFIFAWNDDFRSHKYYTLCIFVILCGHIPYQK